MLGQLRLQVVGMQVVGGGLGLAAEGQRNIITHSPDVVGETATALSTVIRKTANPVRTGETHPVS